MRSKAYGYYRSVILSQFSIWPKGGSSFGAAEGVTYLVVVKSQEVISEASEIGIESDRYNAQALNIESWLSFDYVVNGSK